MLLNFILKEMFMSITTTIESNVFINKTESTDSLVEICDFIEMNIYKWKDYNLLWDLNEFNFDNISTESVKCFIDSETEISHLRGNLKTAILINSTFGFGMMRMLECLAEDNLAMRIEVFKSRKSAMDWLTENETE